MKKDNLWVYACDGRPLAEFIWRQCPILDVSHVYRPRMTAIHRMDAMPLCNLLGLSRPSLYRILGRNTIIPSHARAIREFADRPVNAALRRANGVERATGDDWFEFLTDGR